MKLTLSIFISALCLVYAQSDFNDFTSSVVKEILSFLLAEVHVCVDRSIDRSLISFWLYTRSSTTGTKVDTLAPVMDVKKTIVYIPGRSCNISNSITAKLIHAYLIRYDANVIAVDWCYYSSKAYGDAYCRAPNVAKTVAELLMTLETNLAISVGSIHVLGHSIGGQVAGLIGNHLRTTYNKTLHRITGLDPSGPLYLYNDLSDRLDKTDASFVDVIHTTAGLLGYGPRCGHVDYYPGCGNFQNGCPTDFWNSVGCSHVRAIDYMIESINSNKFRSEKKTLLCLRDSSEISYMGEDSILSYKDYSYICDTNPSSPFAKG